eukprot:Opistho-2@37002
MDLVAGHVRSVGLLRLCRCNIASVNSADLAPLTAVSPLCRDCVRHVLLSIFLCTLPRSLYGRLAVFWRRCCCVPRIIGGESLLSFRKRRRRLSTPPQVTRTPVGRCIRDDAALPAVPSPSIASAAPSPSSLALPFPSASASASASVSALPSPSPLGAVGVRPPCTLR